MPSTPSNGTIERALAGPPGSRSDSAELENRGPRSARNPGTSGRWGGGGAEVERLDGERRPTEPKGSSVIHGEEGTPGDVHRLITAEDQTVRFNLEKQLGPHS